jgi:hypothetical protein
MDISLITTDFIEAWLMVFKRLGFFSPPKLRYTGLGFNRPEMG